jgi:hypothetical protein
MGALKGSFDLRAASWWSSQLLNTGGPSLASSTKEF